MPPRLLALAVLALLGLISVNAAASLAHGEQVNKGQIPFRSFPDPEQRPRGEHQNAMGYAHGVRE
jgi:hypothetical protein